MMKVYIAGSYADRQRMATVARLYIESGIVAFAAWTTGVHEGAPPRVAAIQDLSEVNSADAVIVDCLGSQSTQGGRWLEAGYALGLGKRVMIVGPKSAGGVFREAPGVYTASDHPSAIGTLKAWSLMK